MSYFKALLGLSLLGLSSLTFAQTPPVIVRSGAITLKVSDFNSARDVVAKIAANTGGQVVGGQVRVTDKGKSHGWLRLVVPQAQLDASMTQLRGVGKIFGDSITARTMTEEVKELQSRTQRLQQHQDRLSAVLQNSKRLRGSDILFVQDRLLRAGVDQDMLGHRKEQLVGSANVSNISVFLFEPGAVRTAPVVPRTLGEKTAYAFGEAWTSFSKFMGHVGLFVAGVVVYAIVWVPILILCRLVWKKIAPRLRVNRPNRPIRTGA